MTQQIAGLPAPYRLVHLQEVDSTNADAMRRALAGEEGPLWVVADQQTAGRGRSARSWSSPSGNLYASLLLRVRCPLAKAGQLALVAGVALFDAIQAAGPITSPDRMRLKWPNDILFGRAKAGGILVETSVGGAHDDITAVVGIGLNLSSSPQDLGRAATSLAAQGLILSSNAAVCLLAQSMDAWLKTWNDGDGFTEVRQAWLDRAGARGELLAVNTGDAVVEGYFQGLDQNGALVIADESGAERHVTFGDVMLTSGADDGCAQEKDSRP